MRNPSSKAVWGAVLALALWVPAPAAAHSGPSAKLDKALQSSSSSSELVDVIIRSKPGRESNVNAKVGRHTSDVHTHRIVHAVSAKLSARQIAELANDPDVDGISLNADVSPSAAAKSSSNDKKNSRSDRFQRRVVE